jgi:hypothetical protein
MSMQNALQTSIIHYKIDFRVGGNAICRVIRPVILSITFSEHIQFNLTTHTLIMIFIKLTNKVNHLFKRFSET